MTTGEKIRQQRRLFNITQEELSRLVGVSLKTIQRWETGERSPRLEEANKLSEALNVSAGYLMGEDDTAPAVIPARETHAKSANMVVMTLENGCKVEAPATPEGYAFLECLFMLSMRGNPPATA